MTKGPHPLQPALDRATKASYTVIDLIDIARERKPSGNGREGRTDAKQVSLYKAAIAASVAAIEETFEALVESGLAAFGTPQPALNRIAIAIGRQLQSPNPDNLKQLLQDYLGFDPSGKWNAYLAHSPATNRTVKLKDATLNYRQIHTTYSRFRCFQGAEVERVLARFVKVRNSFAHQDTSTAIFTKSEQALLRRLKDRKAKPGDETRDVEPISATCAVTLNSDAGKSDDPVHHWTVHETHAVNALLLFIGLVASTASSLSEYMEDNGVSERSFEPLALRVQDGRWQYWNRGHSFSQSNIDFELTRYRPKQR